MEGIPFVFLMLLPIGLLIFFLVVRRMQLIWMLTTCPEKLFTQIVSTVQVAIVVLDEYGLDENSTHYILNEAVATGLNPIRLTEGQRVNIDNPQAWLESNSDTPYLIVGKGREIGPKDMSQKMSWLEYTPLALQLYTREGEVGKPEDCFIGVMDIPLPVLSIVPWMAAASRIPDESIRRALAKLVRQVDKEASITSFTSF